MKKLSFTLTALFCILQMVNAQTYFWNGATTTGTGITPAGGTGTWNSATTNWTTANPGNATAWSAAKIADFIGTGATVTLGANESATGITFGVSGYTIAPGAGPYGITITGATPSITLGATLTNTINAPITTGAGVALTIIGTSSPVFTSGGNNSFGSTVALSSTAGSTNFTFSGNNTFTGLASIINSGGGTFNFSGTNTFTNGLTVSQTGGPKVNFSNSASFAGPITISSTGSPTITFSGSGSNSFTGLTTVNAASGTPAINYNAAASSFTGGLTMSEKSVINIGAVNGMGPSGSAGTITLSSAASSGTLLSNSGSLSNLNIVVYNPVVLNSGGTYTTNSYQVAMGGTAGTNVTINWAGNISGGSDVFFGNAIGTGSGGQGFAIVSGTNSWTGQTIYNGKQTSNVLQCQSTTCFPAHTQFIYGSNVAPIANGYGVVDLDGQNGVTIGSLESSISNAGLSYNWGFTNSSSSKATLIIEGGGTSNANATFAATIGIGTTGNTTTLTSTNNNIAITMQGSAGTETFTGVNGFIGGLNLNAGTLVTGVTNALAATLPVSFNGGTLNTGGSSYTQGTSAAPLGTLIVGGSGGTIALGSGNSIYFSNSNSNLHVPDAWNGTLTITGWTGSNHIYVGSDNTGLYTSQLSSITYSGGSYNGQHAQILANGEIVPTGASVVALGVMSPAVGTESPSTTFTITANALGFTPTSGSTVTYSISGIQSNQVVGGVLTGTITFNGSSTSATGTFQTTTGTTFVGQETGSVVLTGNTGSITSISTTPATFTLNDNATFYWNGAAGLASTAVAGPGLGGTGTWTTYTTPTNSWIIAQGSATTGNPGNWIDGIYPAYLGGSQGTVSLDGINMTTPKLNPTSTTVATNNDVITPNNATAFTLGGSLVIAQGVNAILNDPSSATAGTAATAARTLVLTGGNIAGSTGSTITIGGQQGSSTSVYSWVELQPAVTGGSYSTNVPIIMDGTGGGYVDLSYNGGVTGTYTLQGNGTNGAVQIANGNNAGVVLGSTNGYILAVNGITASATNFSSVIISNKPSGTGSGSFIFEGTSNYYGPTTLASAGLVTCPGTNVLSPNSVYTFGPSGQGPTLVLNGNETIGGLASVSGAVGSITSSAGSGNTSITINQGTGIVNTFGLPILNGSSATVSLELSGADNTTSLTLTSTGNTFTGGLKIDANGDLILGAANVLPSGLSVTLNGGTLATGGTTPNNSVNALIVSAANSAITLEAAAHTLTFASMSGISGSIPLTINGWNGTPGPTGTASATTGKIIVSGTVSGTELNNINFTGFGSGAVQVSGTGEIVPAQALLTATLDSISPTTGSELAGTTYTIYVTTTLSTVPTAVVNSSTVTYTLTGIHATQVVGGSLTGTITIPAGSSTGSATFTVQNDNIFEGTETGTVAISNPTGNIGIAAAATLTFTLVDDINTSLFYWNGGTPANNPATGGTGTWSATNAWIAPVNDGTGTHTSWQPGNYNAYLVGPAANAGVITFQTSPNPTNTYVQATGYSFTTSTSPNNNEVLGGTINLPAAYNLNIFTPTTTTSKELDIMGLTSGAGATLTVNQGAATTVKTDLLDFDLANSTIAADINIVSLVTQLGGGAGSVVGVVGNAPNVTVSGAITNTSSQYAYTVLGATSGNSMTISGQITSTSPINFSNGTTGGNGTLLLTNTSNSFTTAYFNGTATNGVVQAGPAGSIPTTAVFVMGATSGSGQNFDLNGHDVTIASLSGSASGTGVITNNASGTGNNTLTVNQGTGVTTTFGLPITNGATATVGLELSGVDNTSSLKLTSASNTFTGGLKIDQYGNLIASGANVLASGLSVALNGGTLTTAGTTPDNSVNALTVSGATSAITLEATAHTLTFASMSGISGSTPLAINGWQGTPGATGTASATTGKIIVSTTVSGSELSNINFAGFGTGALQITGTGEIVPAQVLLTATLDSISPTTGSEAAGTVYTITVSTSLSGVATAVVNNSTVTYTLTGIQATQVVGGSLTGIVTIPAGSSTGTATFTVHNDNIFEGTETGTVAISNPTGDIGVTAATTATFTLIDDQATSLFYWNGGTPTNNPATGGTGTWTTTNAFIAPVNDGTGMHTTWQPGNYNAYLVGPAANAGVITFQSSPNPSNIFVQATGYTLTTSTSPNNVEAIGGTINLPAGYNLNIFTPTTTTGKELGIKGLSSGAGSSLTINQGAATSITTDQLDFDSANTTIATDINIVSAVTQLGGGAGSVAGISGMAPGLVVSGAITNTSSQYAYTEIGVTNGSSMTISGAITSTAPITFSNGKTGGNGVLTLANPGNSFTTAYFNGNATNGFVKAGPVGSIPTTAQFVMGATSGYGQNFDLNGNDVTIASLSSNAGGTGIITNNSPGVNVNNLTVNQTANTTFGLVIADGSTSYVTFTKAGTGSLTLTNANTYTGVTTVSGGTLFVNNPAGISTGTITVQGGTLAGNGAVAGAINVNNGGTIAPGATAGAAANFTTGNETWADGSALTFNITNAAGGPTAQAGTNWGLLTSTGTIDLSSVTAGGITINIDGVPSGFSSATNFSWQFATASAITGFNANKFAFNALGFNGGAEANGNFSVTQSGSTLLINFAPTVGTPTPITISAGTEPTCQLTNATTTTTYATTAVNSTGFNWSLSNSAAGSIDPVTGVMTWANGFSGTVNIQVTANGGDGPSSQVIRTVTITPTVGAPTAITISAGTEPTCQITATTPTTTYASTATNSTGFAWSVSNATAGSINPSTGVMTWTSGFSGSVDILVKADGCNGPSSQVSKTVTIGATVGTPTAITITGNEPSCQLTNATSTTTYVTTATNSTSFTWSLNNNAAGVIDPTSGLMTWANGFSGTVNIQVVANGCNGPSAQVTRTVVIGATVGTTAAITISAGSEPVCQLANGTTTTSYTTTAVNSTSLIWTLSNGAAGSIDPSTGVMTWANGFGGSVNIQVEAAGCNGPSAQVTRTVSISALPSATASNTGPYTPGQTITLNANSASATSYTWSGPASYTASGTPATRASATYAMAGTYTVTVSNSAGCTATATTNVSVVPYITYTWTGATSSAWTTTTNWSPISPIGGPGGDCTGHVVIPAVGIQPVISSSVTLGTITLADNVTLTLNANLNLCGNITGGTSTSATIAGSGLLVLNGTSQQTLSGAIKLQEIQLNNATGAVMAGGSALAVATSLDLTTGNFNATSGTLRFVSTSVTQAAIIDNFSSGNTGTLTGNIIAERYYNSSNTYDQHFIGSPVSAPALSQLGATGTNGYVVPQADCDEQNMNTLSPYGNVFSYHESNPAAANCGLAGWDVQNSGNAANGLGYSYRVAGAGTIALTGAANLNANYPISGLANSNWSNTTLQGHNIESGWQLVSNPYLATLQINSSNSGFDNQIQVWNANGPNAGTFQPGTIGSDAVVAPFQAFYVHVSNPGSGNTYTINASDRVRTSAQFYAQHNNELDISAQNVTSGLMDQTMIAFDTRATDGFDPQFDANKMAGALNRHTIYSVNNKKWMSRNVLNSINTTPTVAVGFEPGATGSYIFSFNNVNTFDATSYIYLEDLKLNVMHDVRSGAYSFTADSADERSRFVIHFTSPVVVSTENATCSTAGAISILQPGSASWNYTLTDANQKVMSTGLLNQDNPVVVGVQSGIYTLVMVDNSNYTVTKTIQVSGAQDAVAGFNVSSNNVSEQTEVQFTNTSQNANSASWNFGDGTTSTTTNVTHTYSNAGTYTVTLTATSIGGCSATTSQIVKVTGNTTGIDNVVNNGAITMWSNENRVYVDFTQLNSVDAVVRIYDILGREMSNDKFTSSVVYQKEINNMDAAYVIVNVINNGSVETKKLFISNTK